MRVRFRPLKRGAPIADRKYETLTKIDIEASFYS